MKEIEKRIIIVDVEQALKGTDLWGAFKAIEDVDKNG